MNEKEICKKSESKPENNSERGIRLLDKLKNILKGKKLKKDNFLIMILMGVLLLVIVWPGSDTGSSPTDDGNITESGLLDNAGDILKTSKDSADSTEYFYGEEEWEAYAAFLEHKLEEVLSLMEGAGKVKVMINLSSSEERIVEKDTPSTRAGTTEVDSEGGSRNTTDMDLMQETVLLSDAEGNTYPFVTKTIRPVIEGVVVAAQGGENSKIIRNITEAIKALFGVDEHKIKIVKMISY